MSIIKQIQVAVRDKSLVINREHVNSLRKFFNNSPRNPRDKIEELEVQFQKRGPFPLRPLMDHESVLWMKKLFLRADGTPRDTEQVRRLSGSQLEVVRNLTGFYFVGMVSEIDSWEVSRNPGHEKAQSYAIFRACANDGRHFDYYNIPWQQSLSGAETGVFVLRSNGGA